MENLKISGSEEGSYSGSEESHYSETEGAEEIADMAAGGKQEKKKRKKKKNRFGLGRKDEGEEKHGLSTGAKIGIG